MIRMEAKLREYRALRRRKELIENTLGAIKQSKDKLATLLIAKIFTMDKCEKEDEALLMENEESTSEQNLETEEPLEITSELSDEELIEEGKEESWRHILIKWFMFTLIWLTFYSIFLKFEFGAVYFVVSLLIIIYLNTRTGPKKRGEVSAYSVFNRNCVSIDGTLKAEQFEREIRYGPGSVR